jgi:hypothetical protein
MWNSCLCCFRLRSSQPFTGNAMDAMWQQEAASQPLFTHILKLGLMPCVLRVEIDGCSDVEIVLVSPACEGTSAGHIHGVASPTHLPVSAQQHPS